MSKPPARLRPPGMTTQALPGGAADLVYAVDARASALPGHDASWSPASQR